MKRTISFLLVVFMLLTVLCACQPANDNSKTTSDPDDVSADANTSETTSETEYVSGVPSDLVYDGEEFIILSGYAFDPSAQPMVYFGGSDDQEFEKNVVNDASVERINRVEERFGIDIKEMIMLDSNPEGGTNSNFYNAIMDGQNSGKTDYHMAEGTLYNMGLLSTAGCWTDLKSLKYLNNLEGEWWSKTFINDTALKDTVDYAVGDISFAHINCIYLIYFNKTVQVNNGVPNLYELVDNNKWTYDKMFELSKDIKKDLDDDPAWTAYDQYGIVGQASIMWAIAYACGEPTVKKDENGLPVVNLNTDSSITKLKSALDYLVIDGNYLKANKTVTIQEGFDTFIQNRTLFMPDHTGNIAKVIGQMTGDFGFLPHPKYDENQEDYYALISPWGGLAVGVPYFYDDETLDYISAVMEEMAVQGKNHLTDAYKEKMIKLQKTKDDQSQDMLDIVFKNSGCELGMIHKFGNYQSMVQLMLFEGDLAIESRIQGSIDKANNDIITFIEAIEAQ